MLVVDASCLYDALVEGPRTAAVLTLLGSDKEHVAPHVIDVEVFGIVRREHLHGLLDATAARRAVVALRDWPARRVGHAPLLDRAWELRDSVRGWDAMYVALAEALDVALVTSDRRLAAAHGPRCRVQVAG